MQPCVLERVHSRLVGEPVTFVGSLAQVPGVPGGGPVHAPCTRRDGGKGRRSGRTEGGGLRRDRGKKQQRVGPSIYTDVIENSPIGPLSPIPQLRA